MHHLNIRLPSKESLASVAMTIALVIGYESLFNLSAKYGGTKEYKVLSLIKTLAYML